MKMSKDEKKIYNIVPKEIPISTNRIFELAGSKSRHIVIILDQLDKKGLIRSIRNTSGTYHKRLEQ